MQENTIKGIMDYFFGNVGLGGWWRILVLAIVWGCQHQPPNSLPIAVATSEATLSNTLWPESFGYGRDATEKEVDSLSIAVLPNGKGLPPGNGGVLKGQLVYEKKCIGCHGKTGVEGPYDVLVGSMPYFSDKKRVAKTIGNYWPYSTTLFDYIRRAMPLDAPGSLTDEEVYSLTAWLLFQNGLIEESDIMDAKRLHLVEMPAKNLFVLDDRIPGPNIK